MKLSMSKWKLTPEKEELTARKVKPALPKPPRQTSPPMKVYQSHSIHGNIIYNIQKSYIPHIPQLELEQGGVAMFCASCGYRNKDGANYCRRCGKPLHRSSARKNKRLWKPRLIAALVGTLLVIAAALGIWELLKQQQASLDALVEEVRAGERPKEKTEIIKQAQEKVYTISTDSAYGSGFLYTDSGAVVTSAHLVVGFYKVLVRDNMGNEEVGRVIGVSEVSDIALIQVDALDGTEPLVIDAQPAEVGEEVIALGSPSGFENTASTGFLTGLDRNFNQDFKYEDLYQIDVQMALGSSGGPLINATTGKVIGINSLLLIESDGIGFSIPMHTVDSQLAEWAVNPMSEEQVQEVFDAYEASGEPRDSQNWTEEAKQPIHP